MPDQPGRNETPPDDAPIRRTDGLQRLRPDRTSQYIGVQIRTGRRLAGMSREALAEHLGIEPATLAAYEHGRFEAPDTTMHWIAELLEKPLAWFFHAPARVAAAPPQPTVLLVDDACDVRLILGAFMESAGLTVITAASGDEALHIIAGEQVLDAIVTDNIMPGLSGVDLLLEAAQLRPTMPGLLVTGYIADVKGAADLPKTIAIMIKPFRRNELVARVRDMLQPPALTDPAKLFHDRAC